MSIIKPKPKENFTPIPNDILHDQRLTVRQRGMLCIILSLKSDKTFSKPYLKALFKEGEKTPGDRVIEEALKKFEETGYLRRKQAHIKGRWEWEYTFYNTPQTTANNEIQVAQNVPIESKKQQAQNVPLVDGQTAQIISDIESSILHKTATDAQRKEIISLIKLHGAELVAAGIIRAVQKGGRSIQYIRACIKSISDDRERAQTAEYGSVADDGRYAATYDIAEIEKQLDAEWYDEWGGDAE